MRFENEEEEEGNRKRNQNKTKCNKKIKVDTKISQNEMISMDDNKHLCVEFLDIHTLVVSHQVKNIDIHKLLIEF